MTLKEKFEEWRDIPNYEEYYQINKEGVVKSLKRIIFRKDNTIQTFKSRILKQYISSNGYKSVSLTKNGTTRMFNIHSLLVLSFINKDYIVQKLVVNHKDGNKLNNDFSNLEIVTSSQNNQHSILNSLNNPRRRKNTKVNKELLQKILYDLKNKNYNTLRDLSNNYNISYSYLCQLKNGDRGLINKQKNY